MADISSIGVNNLSRGVFGNKRFVISELTIGDGADTFPDGGVSLEPEEFGLKSIDSVLVEGASISYVWDSSEKKLNGYVPGATTGVDEVKVAAVNAVPNETVRCLVLGSRG